MQTKANWFSKVVNKMAIIYNRHKVFFISLLILLILYFIIKLFFTPNLLSETQFSKAYFDRNGQLLRMTLTKDDKYRIYIPLERISDTLQKATILYEDKYFYYHPGFNPVSLTKATINFFTHQKRQIGASTITMQVARLKYDLDTTSPSGKLKQIAIATYIDLFYSKPEILEAYLNLAPYGSNIEGIGAASLIYFGKTADQLSKIEAITLSTIPQNPNKRSLNTDVGLSNIMNMRKDLVERWIQEHKEDKKLLTLADMPLSSKRISDLPFLAPHFVNYKNIKYSNYWANLGPKESIITTTLDIKLQKILEQRLSNEVKRRNYLGITNASAIVLNYKTMEVLSYIGSADYFNKQIYGENDGVQALRSPGSTLKPLIYAMAADQGLIHGMTLLKDAKINFGVYAPENADSEFYGPVLAHDALTHSRNIPAINLIKKIGTKNFYKLLQDCGITNLKNPSHYGISIALGGAELSMYELADIYAMMANLGTKNEIKTELKQNSNTSKQILSPEAFFLVLDMLAKQGTPQTTTPFAKHQTQNIIHYWKTGTSSSFRDAWTAGIFGDFVLIVWVGNFDGKPNNSFSGAKTAAPIYFGLANEISNYYARQGQAIKNNNFLKPELNISSIEMCDKVGGLAGKYCPKVVKSYFIPGKSPIETSSIYQAIPIDNRTGLRACAPNPRTTHMEVFEFWDAEYIDMFKRAGIKRKTPPRFVEDCDIEKVLSSKTAPIITYPIQDTKIVIVSKESFETIPFKAITNDTTDTKLFWFLDGKSIGTSFSGESNEYKVSIGEHTIKVMDELGSTSSIKFTVIR